VVCDEPSTREKEIDCIRMQTLTDGYATNIFLAPFFVLSFICHLLSFFTTAAFWRPPFRDPKHPPRWAF
jgi:hypothetical protein